MLKRIVPGLVTLSLIALALLPASTAGASEDRGGAKRGVTLKASSKEVEEGDRLILTAKFKRAGAASRVTLQRSTVDVFGETEWVNVRSRATKGKRRVTFGVVATEENSERYRATVAYRDTTRSTSKPVTVKVWRWIALSEYTPYYESNPVETGPGTWTINGLPYHGWGPYYFANDKAWEARFTPGRHCRSFRGVLGLGDVSDDDASGRITITADNSIVYESPELTPGMDLRIERSLSSPYRLGLTWLDTSPDGLDAWPGIGDPALLCTGVV